MRDVPTGSRSGARPDEVLERLRPHATSHHVDVVDRVRGWIRWWGWSRVASVVVGIPVLLLASFLLFRQPSPPVESGLAYASTSTVTAGSSSTSPTIVDQVPASTSPAVLMVHVAGHVTRPGVYTLPLAARVVDALDIAGGPAPFADLDSVNLAAPVEDGQQVYVPAYGEAPHTTVGAPGGPGVGTTVSFRPVNVNTATVEQLDALPGIGPATAKAIIDYRTENGPFTSVQSLESVPGIGSAKVSALDGLVTV